MNEQSDAKKKAHGQRWNEMLKNLEWYENLAAGWPLVLIFFGGAIGGACGGLGFYLNVKLFNAMLPKPVKYIYSFLIGIVSILLYLLIAAILAIIFPSMFKK